MGGLHQYGGNWQATLVMRAVICPIMTVLGL